MQNALNSKASSSDIPTKVSDLTNDSGFITNTVNNLTNYYTKTNTYTKSEVDSLIGSVSSLDIQIVQTLPTQDISTSTIYLVPKTASTNDNYDEYIYVNNSWEHIGSTEVDLSNYYTKTQTDNLLDDKADASSLSTVATTGSYNDLSNKPTIPTVNNATLTIQKNGTTVKTFTANASSNVTANITVPTKTSDLTNDSGFVDNTYHDSTKQNSLVSGTNIKTINNESLLGSGNINITSGGGTMVDMRVNGSSIVDSNNVGNIATEGTYNATTNKIATMSDVPDELADLTGDSTHRLVTDTEKNTWNNKSDFSGSYTDLTNKPTIPDELADLSDDSTHRLVTDTEKSTWNSKQAALVSGTNIKTINNTSLLGSGNISVATTSDIPTKTSDLTNDSGFPSVYDATYVLEAAFTGGVLTGAQRTELNNAIQQGSIIQVSLFNKTPICGQVVDFGPNIVLSFIQYDKFYMVTVESASGSTYPVRVDYNNKQLAFADDLASKQDTLVSGTNIKTINNESLLGSGNITISSGSSTDVQINGTSIVSNNTANILTETAYNASTNKIATVSDLPGTVSLVDFYNTDFQIMNKHVPKDKSWLFSGVEDTTINISFDSSGTTDMSNMFYQCPNVESISFPWNPADTSTLTSTASMFEGCENLSTISNLSMALTTTNVTNMQRMFYGCDSLTWVDVGYFDTSSVTNMARMFYGCSSLTELFLGNFDFSNVTSYNGIFSGMSDNCIVTVKDQAAQDWVLNLSSSNRPAAWTTANVVIYQGGGGFA